MPEIWRRLEEVGLSTGEACGDTPRNILGCPLAGVDADEILDATAALLRDQRVRVGKQGVLQPAAQVQDGDQRLPGAVHRARDQLRLVRRVSVTRTAGSATTCGSAAGCRPTRSSPQRLGVFVPPGETLEVWAGVTRIFRDYGYRRSRNRARLKFLVADWGPERFREMLESAEYLGRRLEDGPAPVELSGDRDHVGVRRQKDGRNYVGFAFRTGRTSGTELVAVADLADRHGSGRVAATVEQKMVILDVADDQVDALVAALDGARPAGAAVRVPSRDDGLHRAGVLQAGDRRDQGAGRSTSTPSSTVGCPTSTPRSRSTSTAAPTPAPASRSATSASRG